jgi:hypothetical protein
MPGRIHNFRAYRNSVAQTISAGTADGLRWMPTLWFYDVQILCLPARGSATRMEDPV